ncbi:MAG: fibronectin type III domain-containing protein [Deltaproteobacteria bacterium]|nr:fibronectin type III domain-containing protein [Deltaproteobacteria bacterium]
MKSKQLLVLLIVVAAICIVGGSTVFANTIKTKDYWILRDGYCEDFASDSKYGDTQMTISYGTYATYIFSNVFHVDWPGSGTQNCHFFKYDSSNRLMYYGATWAADPGFVTPASWGWTSIPERTRELFLPSVLEVGEDYSCEWRTKLYLYDEYKGYGADKFTISISGPFTTTVRAGTFTTYKFSKVNDEGTIIYYMAKDIGLVKMIEDGITYELMSYSGPPSVSTGSATSLTLDSATLNGTVNPNGSSTTYYFEYGLTSAYGISTVTESAGSGTSEISVTAEIDWLDEGTTYHYRLVAINSVGTTIGEDVTFTTPQFVPTEPIRYVSSDGICNGKMPCYTSIQEAINAAISGDTIKISGESYEEDISLTENKHLTLEGDCLSSSCLPGTYYATVKGSMTVDDGKLKLKNVKLQFQK